MHSLSVTASSSEPVSVGEARLACRLDDGELDIDIETSITAAREQAEHITGRIYRQQVLRTELAAWPATALELRAWPVTGVAISYRSAASPTAWTALPESVYGWGENFPNVQLGLKSGQSWPALASDGLGASVRIDLTAGPESPATVPGSVRRYILASVAAWYDQPSALRLGQTMTQNPLYERLLDAELLCR